MDELQFSNLNQLKGNDILTVQNLTKQTSFAEVFQQSNQSIEKGRLIEYLKRELKSKKSEFAFFNDIHEHAHAQSKLNRSISIHHSNSFLQLFSHRLEHLKLPRHLVH